MSDTSYSLKGKHVAIVGGSSGIGLAVGTMAAAQGARITLISRSLERLQSAAREVGAGTNVRSLNMLDGDSCKDVFTELGDIDHLVLTAVADENKRRAPLGELTDEQFERSLDKLRGFFNVARAATSFVQPRGSILMTSGASAPKPPREGMSVLAATNAAVATFARALALELAPLRVNSVTPGVVDTDVWDAGARARIKAWATSPELPAQRFGTPGDIAQAFVFLMTNPYMTGHDLIVDGGLVAT